MFRLVEVNVSFRYCCLAWEELNVSGICGIVRTDGKPVESCVLAAMVEPAKYRGSSCVRYFVNGSVGMAALSLDSTQGESLLCPFAGRASGEDSILFASDARLDNRGEFMSFSAGRSVVEDFRGGESLSRYKVSDAELMLGYLLNKRDASPVSFVGDFSFAFWDGRQGVLRLARDAMGMRSLYYCVISEAVIFATEVSQILSVAGVPKKLNERAVASYLCDMQVASGSTFYDGVVEVKPGQEVVIGADGSVRESTFWQPDFNKVIRYKDERDYSDHLRDLLIESTRCRIRSSFPLGISLSGGMDSGSVASITGWLQERQGDIPPLRAYSWAFSDYPECDERDLSNVVAERYHIPVRDIYDYDTYPVSDLSAAMPHSDDPYTSIYHGYLRKMMCAAQADGVRTLLSGTRGDVMAGGDVFDVPGMMAAGSFSFSRLELARLKRMSGKGKLGTISKFAVLPMANNLLSSIRLIYRNACDRYGLLKAFRSSKFRGGLAKNTAEHILDDFIRQENLLLESPVKNVSKYFGNQAVRSRYEQIFSSLVMRVMQFNERLCAQHNMQFTDAWSDRRIAEFSLACPQHILHRACQPKRLSRLAMKGIMPDVVVRGARKVSPENLYYGALRGPAYAIVMDLMTNSRCADLGYIDEVVMRDRFEGFIQGKWQCDDIWPALSLEIWLRQYWS